MGPRNQRDGRYIAYVSPIRQRPHVFVTDRGTRTTQIVSTTTNGRPANGASANPAISADGQVVAFQSDASNLLHSEDFNLLWDLFLFDRKADTMTRVSGDPDAAWLEPSGGPALDASGRIVAFSSRHPTDASDKRNDFDLFVAVYVGEPQVVAFERRQQPFPHIRPAAPAIAF